MPSSDWRTDAQTQCRTPGEPLRMSSSVSPIDFGSRGIPAGRFGPERTKTAGVSEHLPDKGTVFRLVTRVAPSGIAGCTSAKQADRFPSFSTAIRGRCAVQHCRCRSGRVALGLDVKKVAVERNREIVPRSTLADVAFAEGDALEIVHFVGGC